MKSWDGWIDLDTGRTTLNGYRADDPQRHVSYTINAAGRTLRRAQGESSILYVGHGRPGRISDLVAGKHPSVASFHRLGIALDGPRRLPVQLLVSEGSARWARIEEAVQLGKYVESHGELPPGNARWEGWWQVHVLRALGALAWDEARADDGDFGWYPRLGTALSSWLDVYKSPRRTPRQLRADDEWAGLLLWIRPVAWGAPRVRLANGLELNGTLSRFTHGRRARRSNPVIAALNAQSPEPGAFSSLRGDHCDVYRAGWLERAVDFERSAVRQALADETESSLERVLGAPEFTTWERA